MRILDSYRDVSVEDIQLLLTEKEARELLGALELILEADVSKQHVHVNDNEYKHEITVALYNEKDINVNTFAPHIMKLLEQDQ